MKTRINIFWHRRDLRLEDNCGAFYALQAGLPVLPLFIFDKNILDKLEDQDDARVSFIHQNIERIKGELQSKGSDLLVEYGFPEQIWEKLTKDYQIDTVYTNHDYEPYAKERDQKIEKLLASRGIGFKTFKDHVVFERQDIQKKTEGVYTVFTPYSKKWRAELIEHPSDDPLQSPHLRSYENELHFDKYYKTDPLSAPSLQEMGFVPTEIHLPGKLVKQGLIKTYDEKRNFPAIDGTSRLGVHFRFGTISIREKVRKAMPLNTIYVNELIWRDFYAQILDNFPHVAERSFRPEYDYIQWRNDEEDFQRWCEGKTGYPIVDAGMRELNTTGYMHNRVRMITASFLTKHLLIDWRWGEAYFARKLLDFDLASNNGGWQWAAGSGTDAAPYFRVFNPYTQQEKFDKHWIYIKKWVPELNKDSYPKAIVDHKFARARCLEVYKAGLEVGKAIK